MTTFERFMNPRSGPLLDAHNHVAVHLNETAITIPCETFVLRCFNERQNRVVVQPEIEDRVHHARHRFTRARSGTETSSGMFFLSPNFVPDDFLICAMPDLINA
jgi:hypothetical protein